MKSNQNARLTKLALLFSTSLITLVAVTASAQEAAPAPAEEGAAITVLGSRIPRIKKEGPAPITTITAETIRANGHADVPEVLKSVTQNGGETQSQQSYGGAITTPGASQVDLRGLGPNHTLVMVNGRRVADFPMPFQGLSNFTDTSNIPLSMIEKIDILSGSASAIYGSDAIAGVVNFTLKKKIDVTTLDYRYGMTEAGGGESHTLSLSTGFAKDRLSIVFGAEYQSKKPLWQYQRAIQDSTLDAPLSRRQRAQYVMARYDDDTGEAIDPGTICPTQLALGTLQNSVDRFGDHYCGSREAVAFGTILSQRESFNTFTGINFELNDTTTAFADIQLGISDIALMNDVTYWKPQLPDGSTTAFFNDFTGLNETWERMFMPEEMGGFDKAMTTNHSMNLTMTGGFRGRLKGDWTYELAANMSAYNSIIKIPQIVSSKATAYFLGAQLGVDPGSDYPIYSANPTKLFTAMAPSQYASISEDARTNAKASTLGLSLSLNQPSLFVMPAGPVGFAAIAELDNQAYEVIPNANATNFGYYYGYAATSGRGNRNHQALGVELSIPLFKTLSSSLATRYDQFGFSGKTIGKLTYNLGLEYRPINSLLLRAAYGTGFRAPDLHYIFAKLDLFHPTVTDYYSCDLYEPGTDYGDCSYADIDILKHREGTPNLKPETSKSFNYGFVWAPNKYFDISADYFKVDLTDQVQDMSLDQVLRDEATCRTGSLTTPTCLDAISRVHRDGAGDISFVYINPINVSNEKTDGIDVELHAMLPTQFGQFKFAAGHTFVYNHTRVQYVGDPTVDMLAADSGFYMPKEKSNASLTWNFEPVSVTLSGSRIGQLPNWNEDEYVKPWTVYNLTGRWDINAATRINLTINNLFDKGPIKDPTWSSYPYYNSNWYDAIGRSGYVKLTYKFK